MNIINTVRLIYTGVLVLLCVSCTTMRVFPKKDHQVGSAETSLKEMEEKRHKLEDEMRQLDQRIIELRQRLTSRQPESEKRSVKPNPSASPRLNASRNPIQSSSNRFPPPAPSSAKKVDLKVSDARLNSALERNDQFLKRQEADEDNRARGREYLKKRTSETE